MLEKQSNQIIIQGTLEIIANELMEKVFVVKLKGYVDLYNSNHLLEFIIPYTRKKILILDFHKLKFIISASLNFLNEVYRLCAANECKLYLVRVNKKISAHLHLLGFDKYFNIYESVEKLLEKKNLKG